jgi:hypothetical protein
VTGPVLHLASKCCSQCLLSGDRIVPGSRAAQIIRDVREADTHFVCHKGSIAGLNLHCRGVHDRFPSRAYRFAVACGIPIVEVDPDTLENDNVS